jgi:hypothetical protein
MYSQGDTAADIFLQVTKADLGGLSAKLLSVCIFCVTRRQGVLSGVSRRLPPYSGFRAVGHCPYIKFECLKDTISVPSIHTIHLIQENALW